MITTCGSKVDIRKLVPVADAVAGGDEPAGGGHPLADADADEAAPGPTAVRRCHGPIRQLGCASAMAVAIRSALAIMVSVCDLDGRAVRADPSTA